MKKDDTVKIPFYKSVFGKMIIAVSLSFLLVIIISFIGLYMGVKGALRTRTETELLRSYKQLEQNLDTFGREVDQVALRVLNGSDLASLVVSHGSQTSMIEQRIDFFSMTDTILAEYSFIDSIVFYNAEDVTLFADGNWNITSENSEKRGKFYTERLKNRNAVPQKKPIWYGGYNSSDFVENDRDNQKLLNYVSVCRPIFRGEKYGWLVLNVDQEHFVSYYNSISQDGGWSEETYMIDQFGRTVSETNVYGIGDEKENLMLQPEAAPKIFESGKNLILCYPVGFCNWTLVNETPISEILGDIQDVQEIFILAIVASVNISILFLVFWVKYMTTPFVKVIDALKMVQNGQFGIVLEQDHENGDEFSLLVNCYNKMTLEISSLIRKNVENEKSKRDAQIRALKSQINPHFLYNTLNTVKWMAIVKGENDIVDCMDALAEMVQPIFRDTRNKWSVEEELTYIKNYCRIMNYRYGEKTVLGIEADSSLMSAMVPKFILQPLVENSFFHGLAEKEMQEHKKFQIYVKGKRKEYKTRDCLELCVYDNGIGISRENCEKLRASLNMEDDGRHIGLRNIYQRIKLLYDMENGVEIGSDNENGFQVLVRIPYEEEKW